MSGAIQAQLEARAQQAVEIIAGKLDLDFKISLHRCPRAALKRWLLFLLRAPRVN
jgi:hypothetical protein